MEIFEKLKAPFRQHEIQWRAGLVDKANKRAQALPYIDARCVQDRLDQVLGPQNWKLEYSDVLSGGRLVAVRCKLSIRVDGEWIDKEDASNFDPSNDLAVKGSHSEALKRAAVQWGIGRYLYGYRAPMVPVDEQGHLINVPRLPDEMLPEEDRQADAKAKPEAAAVEQERVEAQASAVPVTTQPSAKPAAQEPEPPEGANEPVFPTDLSEEEAQSVKDFARRMPGYPRGRLEAYLNSEGARQRFSAPALAYLKKVLDVAHLQEEATA